MYNGIGLATARGSGTNGYVQRNTAFIMKGKEDVKFKTEEDIRRLDAAANREPNQGILDHERKRKLEVKCMELEEVLEEQGYTDAEIEEKVSAYRKMLLSKEVSKKAFAEVDEFGRPVLKETHQIAEAQKEKNRQLKEAFGISEHFVEGSSFDPNRRAMEEACRENERRQDAEEDIHAGERPKKKKRRDSSESSSSDSNDSKRKKEKKRKNRKSRSRSKQKEKRRRSSDRGRSDERTKHRNNRDLRRESRGRYKSSKSRSVSYDRDRRRNNRADVEIKEERSEDHRTSSIQWETNRRHRRDNSLSMSRNDVKVEIESPRRSKSRSDGKSYRRPSGHMIDKRSRYGDEDYSPDKRRRLESMEIKSEYPRSEADRRKDRHRKRDNSQRFESPERRSSRRQRSGVRDSSESGGDLRRKTYDWSRKKRSNSRTRKSSEENSPRVRRHRIDSPKSDEEKGSRQNKNSRGTVNDHHNNELDDSDRISPLKNISSSEKPKRRFQETRRHDSSDRSISPPRARGTLGQEIQDRVASRRHDSSSPPQRRRGSSSSSPSPARDRNQGKEDSSEHTSRDGQHKRDMSGRDEEDRGRLKSRPGPMATMRLYSQSPSPPPELNQWKKREKKIEERKMDERKEQVEVKVEEEALEERKPNNERHVSDKSSNEENEADDDVMKKIKALKKVEKILQKELEARRRKRETVASSSDSSASESEKKKRRKKSKSELASKKVKRRKKKEESSSDDSNSSSDDEKEPKNRKSKIKEEDSSSDSSSHSEVAASRAGVNRKRLDEDIHGRSSDDGRKARRDLPASYKQERHISPPESYRNKRRGRHDSTSSDSDDGGRRRRRRRRSSVDLDQVD